MPIEEIKYPWAENADTGDVSEPTNTKKNIGHKSGDKVYKQWENWFKNHVDNHLNKIVRERVNPYYEDATDAEGMITTQFWDSDSWGLTNDTANIISTGSTKAIVDIKCYFVSNEPRIIALDATNCKAEIWSARTLANVDTSDAFTDDLPAIGTEVWVPRKMYTDGTSLYVTFSDTDASPNVHRIQAWNLADWTVKTGWGATGTALTGTGAKTTYEICKANATHICVIDPNILITGTGDAALNLIDISDGSILRDGSGDMGTAPTGAGSAYARHACSDGTNIYVLCTDLTDNYIGTATIADLTAGTGGTGYPVTVSAATSGRIIQCGPNMIVSTHYHTTPTSAQAILRTHTSATATLDIPERGQNSAASNIDGDEYLIDRPTGLHFDGCNIWIAGMIDNNAGTDQTSLVKLDAAKLSTIVIGTKCQLQDMGCSRFIMGPASNNGEGDTPICSDGRDVWCVIENDASQTDSGKIFRLPLALIRH